MRPRRHERLNAFCATFFALALWTTTARAGSANVSVDDTYGDTNTGATITYTPASSWNVGQNCSACTANPDANGLSYGSWHDATYYPANSSNGVNKGSLISASYTFTGSAVFVYCVTTLSSDSPDGNTDLTFFVDGETVGKYEQTPTGRKIYSYDVLVYSNASLTQGEHKIEIVSGYNDTKALFILDRIMYTTDSEDVTTTIDPMTSSGLPATLSTPTQSFAAGSSQATSQSSSHAGTIAGAVVGSVAGVALIVGAALFFLWRRKREVQKAEEEAEKAVQPFVTNGDPPSNGSHLNSALGLPVRSRFSPDSSLVGDGSGYPARAHRFSRRHRTREGHASFSAMHRSQQNVSDWARDLLSLGVPNLPAPAPPYTPRSTESRTRPRISTSPRDQAQSSHSGRATTQKLPTSPLYSPVPGLTPDAMAPSNPLPGASRSDKKTTPSKRRFHLPTLRVANRSPPNSSSPFMPTDLYTSTQRLKPSAWDLAGKDLGAHAGTYALDPNSSLEPINSRARMGQGGMVADTTSVSGSTVVEGGKNAAILEEHRNRRGRKGAGGMLDTLLRNGETVVGGTEQGPPDMFRRPSVEEEGSTVVNASGFTPRIHGGPLPPTDTLAPEPSSARAEKEVSHLPMQSPPGSSGRRPLPARPLPQPRGGSIVPALGRLSFEKKEGSSS